MVEPERRRRRPPVSCTSCRKRKIRCNKEVPCSNCLRSRNPSCVFDKIASPPPARQNSCLPPPGAIPSPESSLQSPTSDDGPSSTRGLSTVPGAPPKPSTSSLASPSASVRHHAIAGNLGAMVEKIVQLEEQLSKATASGKHTDPPPASGSEITPAATAQSHDDIASFQIYRLGRGFFHKTRLFGQSHWMNGLVPELLDAASEIQTADVESIIFSSMKKCKSLAKVIKIQRAPGWPLSSSTALPSKDVADELVDCYLRTTESIYRIIHVPSFRRSYEALWTSESSQPDKGFLTQLKLVLAIGAVTYDENFSLRTSATRWVYEGHAWLSDPDFKSQFGIQFVQNSLLLLLAREMTSVGRDLVWVTAGTLFRTAVFMGLHRDPSHLPKKTAMICEMRRRLWNTILELALQSSMFLGSPPFLNLADFDTEPPGNFDDDQLLANDPVPKSEDDFTQMTLARNLRKTFPIRLAVARFLNDLSSTGAYDEALRLDSELRTSYKTVWHALQSSTFQAGLPSSSFGLRAVDFIMHRYLSSLHIPFFGPSLRQQQSVYAFSRRVVVELSLKIWCSAYPSTSLLATSATAADNAPRSRDAAPSSSTSPSTRVAGRDDLPRFIACGSGFFRMGVFQATLLVASELRAQARESDCGLGGVDRVGGLGSAPLLRPDLLAVVDEAKSWSLRCIEAGETNVKGYLLNCLVAAQIRGLARGLRSGKEFSEVLAKEAEEAEKRYSPLLEDMAGQAQVGGGSTRGVDGADWNAASDEMGGLDAMVSDSFAFDDGELMGWLFDDEMMHGLVG